MEYIKKLFKKDDVDDIEQLLLHYLNSYRTSSLTEDEKLNLMTLFIQHSTKNTEHLDANKIIQYTTLGWYVTKYF